MTIITLYEYHNVGGKKYQASGNTFTFGATCQEWATIPPDTVPPRMHLPTSIKKNVTVKWRIRRAGYEKKIERARFRYNEKIEFTFAGMCKAKEQRDHLEWLAKRDSVFKVTGLAMDTYHSEETDDVEKNGEDWGTPVDWASAKNDGPEDVYVVFENIKFTETEGKGDPTQPKLWYGTYTIKFRRVHLTRH